jgi:hypothetical protein
MTEPNEEQREFAERLSRLTTAIAPTMAILIAERDAAQLAALTAERDRLVESEGLARGRAEAADARCHDRLAGLKALGDLWAKRAAEWMPAPCRRSDENPFGHCSPVRYIEALKAAELAATPSAQESRGAATSAETCEYHPDDDGFENMGPACGKPATHVSCTPYVRTPTCAEHKCRCAKLLANATKGAT